MKNTANNNIRARFNYLKSMFRQAPLSKSELNELVKLSERFDAKMAEYLKTNCI